MTEKIHQTNNFRQLQQSGSWMKNIIKKSQFIASAYKITKVEDKTEILENISED